ncbi:MAG: hypothetical protein HUM72_24820 [Dolichospermum sp.]|nr:hypothetical protein [Dolichospermum sp.]
MNPEKTKKKAKSDLKKGQELNIYGSKQINGAGGIESFNKLIENDKSIKVPKIEFTDQEWEEMEMILKQ